MATLEFAPPFPSWTNVIPLDIPLARSQLAHFRGQSLQFDQSVPVGVTDFWASRVSVSSLLASGA